MAKELIKFPGQFHSFRKTTLGDNLITFSVDRAYSQSIKELVSTDIGTEYVVHLEDVTSSTNLNKDNKELKERFMNKMHGLLGQLAEEKGCTPEIAKEKLRSKLREMDLIKKSTTELDLKGLSIACNIVEKWLKN